MTNFNSTISINSSNSNNYNTITDFFNNTQQHKTKREPQIQPIQVPIRQLQQFHRWRRQILRPQLRPRQQRRVRRRRRRPRRRFPRPRRPPSCLPRRPRITTTLCSTHHRVSEKRWTNIKPNLIFLPFHLRCLLSFSLLESIPRQFSSFFFSWL